MFGDINFLAGKDVAQGKSVAGADGQDIVKAERRSAALFDIADVQRV